MLLKTKKRLTAYVLAALCVASTGFAATEHWNDASTTPKTVVATQAGDANWEQWKTSWESIKNDYEQVSMAPGKATAAASTTPIPTASCCARSSRRSTTPTRSTSSCRATTTRTLAPTSSRAMASSMQPLTSTA